MNCSHVLLYLRGSEAFSSDFPSELCLSELRIQVLGKIIMNNDDDDNSDDDDNFDNDDGDDHIGSQKYICSLYSTIVAIIAGKGPQSTAGLLSITYYIY